MEIDFFAPWILTHGIIDGKVLRPCDRVMIYPGFEAIFLTVHIDTVH